MPDWRRSTRSPPPRATIPGWTACCCGCTPTACRRGGALALRSADLDPDECLVLLREKGETVRWQPVSPTLMAALVQHAEERHVTRKL